MRVFEFMTRNVECARPDESLATAAQKMRDLDIGALPVCDDHGGLVGMITDRDITIRATANGGNPESTFVRDVMTPQILYVFDSQLATQAAEIMKQNQIRRLPVLNRGKRLVGIVSLADLAIDAQDEELAGATLEAISEPAEFQR